MRWPPRLVYVGIGLVLSLLVGGMSYVLHELHQRSEQYRYGEELVMWDFMSSNYLLANLQIALLRHWQAPLAESFDELQYRFDLAWSRFENARNLSREDYRRIGAAQTLERGQQLMQTIEPYIAEPGPLDGARAAEFIAALQALREAIKRLGQADYEGAERRRMDTFESIDRLFWRAVWLFAATLAVASLIVALLVREHRTARTLYHDSQGARRKVDEMNQELRAHRDNLQTMVDERTADLIVARDQAESANAAKSDFLANMSHELRTPMHAILSFANIGRKRCGGGGTAAERNYYKPIRESAERLMVLLDDLLDLAKLEAGRLELRAQMQSILPTVELAVAELQPLARQRNVSVSVSMASKEVDCWLDSDRILQVVRNLLSNAIKFSRDGGRVSITVSAGTLADETEAPAVVVAVEDHGVGIPEAELGLVFDKFTQSSHTKSGAGGTGLGLAISKELVEIHGGTISAECVRPCGARLTFRLPREAGIASVAA